jgi:hypothetical protein
MLHAAMGIGWRLDQLHSVKELTDQVDAFAAYKKDVTDRGALFSIIWRHDQPEQVANPKSDFHKTSISCRLASHRSV